MFPAGPQLQSRWKHPQTAKNMFYRWEKTGDLHRECDESATAPEIYDDILCGQAYLDAAKEAPIDKYDTVLMLSIDGAQLYRNKKSDSLGAEGVLPSRQIESFLRVFKQFTPNLPSRQVVSYLLICSPL